MKSLKSKEIAKMHTMTDIYLKRMASKEMKDFSEGFLKEIKLDKKSFFLKGYKCSALDEKLIKAVELANLILELKLPEIIFFPKDMREMYYSRS